MSENISTNKKSKQLFLEASIGFWSAIGTTIASGLFFNSTDSYICIIPTELLIGRE
jgi:hypothetical protein